MNDFHDSALRGDALPRARKTRFLTALRPFSLTVAVATCGLGAVLAAVERPVSDAMTFGVVVAGVLLQVGVNLINDHADLGRVKFTAREVSEIRRNARIGWSVIVIACLLGLWFIALRGWPLALLGAFGVLGLWGYAADPINLKSRGLGLPAVFLFTGVLIVCGSYYALIGEVTARVLAWSVPPGLFAALLLLGNELRDYEEDVRDGHGTFSVRFGARHAAILYRGLAATIAGVTVFLALAFGAPLAAAAAPALAFLPLRHLEGSAQERRGLARGTGRTYALYSVILISGIWISSS